MPTSSLLHRLLRGDLAIIFYLSLARLMLHLAVNASGGYGLFRDELYYLACADHPALGYVDQPPFSALLLKMVISVFGDTLFAVRLVPAFAGACTVFLTGLITLRLGGNRYAQFLACICAFSFITLGMNSYYSMNSIDILIWTMVAYIILRIIQEESNKKLWIVLGIVLGIGLLNKISVLFLGAGLFTGLILTPQRRWLATPWPYVAGMIAMVCFAPYIIWNLQHDLAHLEFIHNASTGKYASLSPMRFIGDQFLLNNPIASIVWMAGLLAFIFFPPLKEYRLLVFLYIVPFIILVLNTTSKAEYLSPAYTVLWASGSIWIESLTARTRYIRALRIGLSFLIIFILIALMPLAVPLLPVEKYINYSKALGFEPSSTEDKELSALPQFYADMFGWKEKAVSVAAVYNSLSEADQEKCAIFGNNYGRCGAIDYYGAAYDLPKAIGNHNNYWIWGPRHYTGEVVIIMGGSYDDHKENFESVELAAVSDCEYCMPYEDNMKIFLCRGLKASLSDIWGSEKHYE